MARSSTSIRSMISRDRRGWDLPASTFPAIVTSEYQVQLVHQCGALLHTVNTDEDHPSQGEEPDEYSAIDHQQSTSTQLSVLEHHLNIRDKSRIIRLWVKVP